MVPVAEKEALAPTVNLSNFASWYRHLRLESDDQNLLLDLREAIPGFEHMDLKPAGIGNYWLVLTFSTDEQPGLAKQSFPYFFYDLSDGQRVLIGLYSVLHFGMRPGTTVLFDEPDNFVALREIQPWLEKVLERVEDEDSNTQVLIASHHPELLNRMAFESGILLDRPGGRHTRARPFDDPSQTGLSAAELIARGWEHE
jgi:predicted ATPase